MRRLVWIVALALLVAACISGSVETTTSSSEVVASSSTEATTTTSTTAPATTTTTEPEVVRLGLRGSGSFMLRPGVTYLHDFVVPTHLRFDREGWAADVVGERMIGFLNDEGESSLAVYVTFMADSVEELLAFVQEHEKTIDVTDPAGATVAGLDAVTVDVLVPPGESPGFGEVECWGSYSGPVWYSQVVEGTGYASVLVGCAWNRVWIMDVDGASVVIHAADVGGDPNQDPVGLEPVEPLIDEFLDAISFNP